jgi:hypothetical protein
VQLIEKCEHIVAHGVFLFLEIITFSRELIKVAPASLQPQCYFSSALAMTTLKKLEEADEVLHEGLAVCPDFGDLILSKVR